MIDESRKFCFTMPDEIFDAGLSTTAFRLYVHIRKVESERGSCTETRNQIAEVCRISTGSVTNARRELERYGFIRCTKVKSYRGRQAYEIVTTHEV